MTEKRTHNGPGDEVRVPSGAPRWIRRMMMVLLVEGAEILLALALVLVFFLGFTGILVASFPRGTGLRDFYGDLIGGRRDTPDVGLGREARRFVAELLGTTRVVKDRPPHAVAWRDSWEGMPLGNNHAVQTLSSSGAVIAFEGASNLELGQNSLVVLRQTEGPHDALQDRATLIVLGGEVRGQIVDGDGTSVPLDVVAAGATTRLDPGGDKPADFQVKVNPDQSATLRILSGSAEVSVGDSSATLRPNEALTVRPGEPLGRVQTIPSTPKLLEPRDGAVEVFGKAPPEVALRWKTTRDAETYRLVIARDPAVRDALIDQRVSGSELELATLPAGQYYWQVSAVRADIEGDPSQARSFRLVQDLEPPELTVQIPERTVESESLLLRGATEPGAKVLIGLATVPTTKSGRFEHTLSLRPGPNLVVVEAADAFGNVAYFSQYVNAKFSAAKDRP